MSGGVVGTGAVDAAFDAARAGDTARLAALLDGGVAVNSGNERGDTLLMLAAYHCREDAVCLLLERGADPNAANAKGQKPLAGASWKGSLPVVRALVEHGASVNDGGGAMTPLMLAAMCGHRAIVECLLAHGADPATCSRDGHTARSLAANIRAQAVVDLLDAAALRPG